MALRKIVQEGDEVLRKKTFPVEKFDNKLHLILDDMRETLQKVKGAGLAAPQIGILRQIVIVDLQEGYYEMINPQILEKSGEQIGVEACLSVQGRYGRVKRPKKIKVAYQNRYGEEMQLVAEDFLARAICHELDHLNGVLYIDRASEIWIEGEKE